MRRGKTRSACGGGADQTTQKAQAPPKQISLGGSHKSDTLYYPFGTQNFFNPAFWLEMHLNFDDSLFTPSSKCKCHY